MAGIYKIHAGILVRHTAVYIVIIIYHVQVYSVVKPHSTMPDKEMKKQRYTPPEKKEKHSGNRILDLVLSGSAIHFLTTRLFPS